MSNEKNWHITIHGQKHGPYSNDELKQMAIDGTLNKTDKVRSAEMTEWIAASNLMLPFADSAQAPADTAPGEAGIPTSPRPAPRPTGQPGQPVGGQAHYADQFYGSPANTKQSSSLLTIVIVVVVVLVVLLGAAMAVLLPALGAARRTARRMQNGTQVRGVQQSLVLYSQSNREFYPGRTVDGSVDIGIPAGPKLYGGNAPSPTDHTAVYALLLNGEFFTPEYIVSPADDLAVLASLGPTGTMLTNAGGGGGPNYSYAMLEFAGDGQRQLEWRDTNNSQAPIIADPSSQIRNDLKTHTYHSDVSVSSGPTPADYEGNIAWNDNHVTFENSSIFAPGMLKLGSKPNANAVDLMAGGQGQPEMGFNK